MNQDIIDLLNGKEPETSDKIMQCEVCKGFYPVRYYWVTLIRCRECTELDITLYNKRAEPDWKIREGAYAPVLGY